MVVSAAMLNRQQKQQIQQHTGKDPDKMSQEELQQAVDDLELEPQQDQGAAPAAPVGAPQQDYTAELERLADLRSRGIITEEEFEAKKRQILGI
jgi:hypothetical protein